MNDLEPNVRYNSVSLREELKLQAENLEAMFEDPGLQRLETEHPDHPALARFRLLSQLVEGEGRFNPNEEQETFLTIGGALIDRSTWAIDPVDSDYWSFIPDDSAREYIRRRIRIPDFYDDVVAELFFWGWLRSHGISSMLCETDGLPDLKLISTEEPIWADVKRIHIGSVPGRVRKVIGKANEQIKKVDHQGVGLALIHIDRIGLRAALDDRIPSDVQPFVEEAIRELSSDVSKSVGQVVITWDDFFVLSGPDRPTLYAVRRRSVVRQHTHPRQNRLLVMESSPWGSRRRFGRDIRAVRIRLSTVSMQATP